MRILTYKEAHEEIKPNLKMAVRLYDAFVAPHYAHNDNGRLRAANSLATILPRLDPEKNPTVLDLGCGGGDDISCQPYFCRALYSLKIRTIGVDFGNLQRERFEHHCIDLWTDNALQFMPDHSIDIANSTGLIDSPSLSATNPRAYAREKWGAGFKVTPLEWRDAEKDLFEALLPQLERIVKPDGLFIYSNNCGA